jgi:hypothetical protein
MKRQPICGWRKRKMFHKPLFDRRAEEEVAKGVTCQSKVSIVRMNNFCIFTAKTKIVEITARKKAIIARVRSRNYGARMIAVDCN